ncbi:MAG: hypothetical protein RL375_3402 [Pseudomonadota bacterium]|jgi:hypothetical protein
MSMTHRESCALDGEYLQQLPFILASESLDESRIEHLSWDDIETAVGYCIDRCESMPAGSVVSLGSGTQQAVIHEWQIVKAQRQVLS